VIATVSLQEMAARLGLISRKDLAAVISELKSNRLLKVLVVFLVFSAIVIGNTAYEAGNLSGGSLGLEVFTGSLKWSLGGQEFSMGPLITGIIAFLLLLKGSIKSLQYVLLGLVIAMSIAFVSTAVLTKPDLSGLAQGLFTFNMPEGSVIFIVGLIGTTVVPYNLFLHSALVIKKWDSAKELGASQFDTIFAVVLGGLVSMSVLIAAASVDINQVISGADLAVALQPVFGLAAKYLMAMGLFAAGLTSAITAPMAAAFVITGLFGGSGNTESLLYKGVWMSILLFGILVATFNVKPIALIMFAQVANGVLLPIIAIILIWIMNQKSILGAYRNSFVQNVVGMVVFLITVALSYRILINVFY
jgi:Mn2+/Fe2+ NRAMP family transporter